MKIFLITLFLLFIPIFSFSIPSSILIDTVSGEEIIAHNADKVRYPASLTKLMTLYIVFDYLKAKRISLDDAITISYYAAIKPSSKLYLKPGRTLTVDQAIKAIAIKSANDVATAMGEHIGGTEKKFAAIMNAKARELGLEKTRFSNASGLPNRRQVSTARDIAKLTRSLLNTHSEYSYFFAMPHFSFNKRKYKNTNTLLGKVKGVDGVKTGYTRAAGWCLVASQDVEGHKVVGVVMGEKTDRRRDVMMTYLLQKQIPTLKQIREAERKLCRSRRRRGSVVFYWAVQTGAFRTRKQAICFNKQLKKSYTNLLQKKSLFTRLVKSMNRKKSHYTTRVGRFSSKTQAQKLCHSMKEKSLSCLVVKSR